MTTYRSELTGKTYRIDAVVIRHIDGDTGLNVPGYRDIVGTVNGKDILRETVSAEHIMRGCRSMERALEGYLDGKSHITHYDGFPEIAAALQ